MRLEHLARRRQTPIELRHVDLLEPLEHHRAPLVALADDAAANVFERGTRQRLVRRQLVEDLERDVELPDGAERLRQPPDLAAGFAAFVPLTPAVRTGTASRRRREATRA